MRLLRLSQVMEITGLRKTSILEAVKENRFPRPIAILENGRATGWLESDINTWIQGRIAARDAEAA
jgi:prophage regulatory protein